MDKVWLLVLWENSVPHEPIRVFDYHAAVTIFRMTAEVYDAVYLYVTDESGAMRRVDTEL